MKYVLRLKSNNERVFAHDAASLEEAKQHFMLTKQMDEATFDSMFIVKEYMIDRKDFALESIHVLPELTQ